MTTDDLTPAEKALKELEQTAQPAEPDTEEKLARMRRIKAVEIPRLEEEYVTLRDELVETMEGARFFIDDDGNKIYGFPVRPEKTVTDLSVLEGELPPDVFETITERKLVTNKFKAAVSAGRIPAETFVKATKIVPGTAHIRFNDGGRDEA